VKVGNKKVSFLHLFCFYFSSLETHFLVVFSSACFYTSQKVPNSLEINYACERDFKNRLIF